MDHLSKKRDPSQLSRSRLRNRIGLPFSARHRDLLEGTSITVFAAVARSIESSNQAVDRLADKIKRLNRRTDGQDAAASLLACRHRKADGLPSDCNVCALIYRKWIVPQAIAFEQKVHRSATVVVLTKEVDAGGLKTVDLVADADALKKRLKRLGCKACIGNMEVAYKPERQTWSVHAHLLVFGPSARLTSRLKKQLPLKRAVDRRAIRPRTRVRQISYLFKFVTYYRHSNSSRVLPLPDSQLVELARWRRQYRLDDHLILIGFQRRGAIVPGQGFRMILSQEAGWRRGDVAT